MTTDSSSLARTVRRSSLENFGAAFRDLVRHAAVPHIRIHDLRHTHASLLGQAGIPMHVTSKRLGHSSLAITADIYSHIFASQDREAAMAFEAHVARSSECDTNVIFRAATARIA
jgi:integrase